MTSPPLDGVNVVGYFYEASGLGEIARLVVRSLSTAGIAHDTIPVGARPLTSRLERRQARYGTSIVCINASELPRFVDTLGRRFMQERRTIGFWWWEVDTFPSSGALAAHLVDEIWVGSEHVRRAVAAATDTAVEVFPVPIVAEHATPLDTRELGVDPDRFTFLFAFNFSSAFERKNPLGVIGAFTRAFQPTDGAQLVLKTMNGAQWPRQRAAVEHAAAGRRDIVILDQPLPRAGYIGLVASCDAYVSLHRAEGFGLTIAEAMGAGKPAVATGYSGNLEFMTDENSFLVPYELVQIPHGSAPYPNTARWAEPDRDAAAAAMRAVFELRDEARARGARGRRDIDELHGFARAASFLTERLGTGHRAKEPPSDSLERAAYELMWGPDLDLARPWARRVRRAFRPVLRPYLDHQREIGSQLIEAIRERRRE